MDDLISRSAAIEAAIDGADDWDGGCNIDREKYIERHLNEVPAIDAEPVVHGKWIHLHGYATPGGDPVWGCSVCGKGIHVYDIEHRSYGANVADGQWVSCPNCGAKMDGEQMEATPYEGL